MDDPPGLPRQMLPPRSRCTSISNQWRRQDFFGGDAPPLKGYHPPPAGGPGEPSPPPDGSEVSFIKRCKVLENESSFQKYQHFSCPKDLFFIRKKSERREF